MLRQGKTHLILYSDMCFYIFDSFGNAGRACKFTGFSALCLRPSAEGPEDKQIIVSGFSLFSLPSNIFELLFFLSFFLHNSLKLLITYHAGKFCPLELNVYQSLY